MDKSDPLPINVSAVKEGGQRDRTSAWTITWFEPSIIEIELRAPLEEARAELNAITGLAIQHPTASGT